MTPSDFAALQEGHVQLTKQVASVEGQLVSMRVDLLENTEATTEILGILAAAKTGFKVIGWLGTALKWGASIGAAVLSLMYAWSQYRGLR